MPELRGIDANIILRYLLRDNIDQWEKATRLIESNELLALTAVALAEVAWTLTGQQYRMERGPVAVILLRLIARENISLVGCDKAQAQAALQACARPVGAAGFGDALITACSRSFSVREIYSFDRRFDRTGLTSIAPL